MQFIPAYFPSIEYVSAVIKAQDREFTLNCNYQKQTFRNRCSIYGANGKLNLVIPVQHNKSTTHQKDHQVKIMWQENWQKLHWKSLESAYRSSPFFEFYEDELKDSFFKQPEKLSDYTIHLLQTVFSLLDIEPCFNFKENYTPLSPLEERLINAKIPPIDNFPIYHQVFDSKHGFISNLSILDLLFNEGPQSIYYLAE